LYSRGSFSFRDRRRGDVRPWAHVVQVASLGIVAAGIPRRRSCSFALNQRGRRAKEENMSFESRKRGVRPAFLLGGMGVLVLLCVGGTQVYYGGSPPSRGSSLLPGQEEPVLQGEENAVLVSPPHVPPPIRRNHPTKVIVQLETREVVKR